MRHFMHPHQHRINLCNEALESVRGSIPEDLFRDVNDYINQFDEWGLGIEMLIDQISELEITITPEQFDLIRVAMASMELENSDSLVYLREHGVVA